MPRPIVKPLRVQEDLHHFVCQYCEKWWSIGGAPVKKEDWHCPWCGKINTYKKSASVT